MNIEAFLLCDAATDSSGKLNVLGAFDTIVSPSFPTTHPQCALVARIRCKRIERGDHKVIIHIVDEDGKFIISPIDGSFNIIIPDTERSGAANIILNLQGLKIDREGEIAINLAIDGKEIGELPLHVKKSVQ